MTATQIVARSVHAQGRCLHAPSRVVGGIAEAIHTCAFLIPHLLKQ